MFPSLINCCTIDWFTEWPEDALEKVATKFLEDMDMDDEVTFLEIFFSYDFQIFSIPDPEKLRENVRIFP